MILWHPDLIWLVKYKNMKKILYTILFLFGLGLILLAWRYYEIQQFEKQKKALLDSQSSATTTVPIETAYVSTTTSTTTEDTPTGLVTHIKRDNDMFKSLNIASEQIVSSPLTISGEVRGNWYFEATFPVELRTLSGTLLAQGYAQAQSDWMTTNFVPFIVSPMSFPTQPSGSQGVLILKKDNPSGEPINDDELQVVVGF